MEQKTSLIESEVADCFAALFEFPTGTAVRLRGGKIEGVAGICVAMRPDGRCAVQLEAGPLVLIAPHRLQANRSAAPPKSTSE